MLIQSTSDESEACSGNVDFVQCGHCLNRPVKGESICKHAEVFCQVNSQRFCCLGLHLTPHIIK